MVLVRWLRKRVFRGSFILIIRCLLPMSVIFCSQCSFCSLSPLTLTNHISTHPSPYYCGIDGCNNQYTLFRSFRDHLRRNHASFYPVISCLPNFSAISSFSLQNRVAYSLECTQPTPEFDGPPLISDIEHEPIQNNFHDQLIDTTKQKFIETLIQHGIKFNIPFKCVQSLSSHLVDMFYELNNENSISDELIYSLKQCVSSQETFDYNLEQNFGVAFPQVIDIFGSSNFF